MSNLIILGMFLAPGIVMDLLYEHRAKGEPFYYQGVLAYRIGRGLGLCALCMMLTALILIPFYPGQFTVEGCTEWLAHGGGGRDYVCVSMMVAALGAIVWYIMAKRWYGKH